MDNLRAVEAGPQTFTVLAATDMKAAIEGVRQGGYKACLIIPSDFSKKVALKTQARVRSVP